MKILSLILLFILTVIGFLLPRTGPLTMVNEICGMLAAWIMCGFLFILAKRIIKRDAKTSRLQKTLKIFTAAVCLWICVLYAYAPVLDLTSGPKTDRLTELRVGKLHSRIGYFLRYYMTGANSQGDRIQLEITEEDCTRLTGCNSVTVKYYRYTGRTLEIQDAASDM